MFTAYTETDAWQAYEQQHYSEAVQIWMQLMSHARDVRTHLSCQHGYALTLMAQKQFREAEAIVQELYEQSGEGRYLHLLGQIALDCERLDLARIHFLAEQTCLSPQDSLNRSLNANALAWIALKQQNLEVAAQYARLSLDYAAKTHHLPTLSTAYQLLGDVFSARRDRPLAAEYYEAAQLALAEQALPPAGFESRLREFLLSHPELYCLNTEDTVY